MQYQDFFDCAADIPVIVIGTTPTLVFEIDESVDLSAFDSFYISIKQNDEVLVKTGESVTVDGNDVSVYLPQEETLKLYAGQATIMLNCIANGEQRGATDEYTIVVRDNHIRRKLE